MGRGRRSGVGDAGRLRFAPHMVIALFCAGLALSNLARPSGGVAVACLVVAAGAGAGALMRRPGPSLALLCSAALL
ncbi:MAG: hypothetical protein JHC74_10180, partial [Thermoleophilia bacterium]|nr:hypothetical protein [Thermoleophilia bacterium]